MILPVHVIAQTFQKICTNKSEIYSTYSKIYKIKCIGSYFSLVLKYLYSKLPRVRTYFFLSLAKQVLVFWGTYQLFQDLQVLNFYEGDTRKKIKV